MQIAWARIIETRNHHAALFMECGLQTSQWLLRKRWWVTTTMMVGDERLKRERLDTPWPMRMSEDGRRWWWAPASVWSEKIYGESGGNDAVEDGSHGRGERSLVAPAMREEENRGSRRGRRRSRVTAITGNATTGVGTRWSRDGGVWRRRWATGEDDDDEGRFSVMVSAPMRKGRRKHRE